MPSDGLVVGSNGIFPGGLAAELAFLVIADGQVRWWLILNTLCLLLGNPPH